MTRIVIPACDSAPGSRVPAGDAAFAAFRAVLSDHIVNKTRLPSVRQELISCVSASHERAVSMLHYLRLANDSGLITDKTMRVLVNDIQDAVDATPADQGSASAPQAGLRPTRSPGRLLAGRFQICERAGLGGIGEIFLARDLGRVEAGHSDPRVAVKILQRRHVNCPDAIRSLQREAVNAQCLVHPGIRRVFEMNREGQRFFLVMEWLNGETLAARLDRTKGQPMAIDAFRALLLQITSALAFAHRHGIVHGDIKPGNIFITVQGETKLLDFGHTDGVASRARSEPFALTRGYSSLEVHRGYLPEIRDDIYSLSVMTYRMLAGRRPFGRLTAVEAEQTGLRPERPPMLNTGQWKVLRAGLALHRVDRLASVAEFREGLLSSPVRPAVRPHLVVAA